MKTIDRQIFLKLCPKNKFEKYRIPVFQCQLAQDSENHKKKLAGNKILEVKLDGIRVITIIHTNGSVDMFSRNGKVT